MMCKVFLTNETLTLLSLVFSKEFFYPLLQIACTKIGLTPAAPFLFISNDNLDTGIQHTQPCLLPNTTNRQTAELKEHHCLFNHAIKKAPIFVPVWKKKYQSFEILFFALGFCIYLLLRDQLSTILLNNFATQRVPFCFLLKSTIFKAVLRYLIYYLYLKYTNVRACLDEYFCVSYVLFNNSKKWQ